MDKELNQYLAADVSEGERGNRRGPKGYRCCRHCSEDFIHDVETDGHDGPCSTCDDPGMLLRERLEEAEATLAKVRAEAEYPSGDCYGVPFIDPADILAILNE